jgi:hypothetical protein
MMDKLSKRLIIRGLKNGVQVFEEHVNPSEVDLAEIARQHVLRLGVGLFMVEIEFPDEPDANQRFLRFGTDPSGMLLPCPIDLEKLQ